MSIQYPTLHPMPCPVRKHLNSTCSDSTMSSLHPISTSNVQNVPQCIQPMSSLFKASLQAMCRDFVIHSTAPGRTPYLQHLYWPCLVSTLYLLHIYSQNTMSHGYFQSVHHPSCPCPVSTPSLPSITSEIPTLPVHVMSIHLSCPPKAI